MTTYASDLADLGWNPFFTAQLDPDERPALLPVRVMAVHRDRLHVTGPGIDTLVPPFLDAPDDPGSAATVGDWLLLDDALRPRRLLKRRSLFKRRAAGTGRRIQLIAANVDTLFIVSSCNQDFSVARLERYLALAGEAEVTPVVVLTKTDLADDPAAYVRAAAALLPGLRVELVDSRDPASVAGLLPWCGHGQTVALVGSSGVGKSTLINTLTRTEGIATQSIRVGDDTGRHTTTGRQLYRLPAGGWLVDTPGMRELPLADVKSGIEEVFADLAELAGTCRFADCRHEAEPGCAVRAAVEAGTLDAGRLQRWRKLGAEEARNTMSLADRRARSRAFGKMGKRATKDKQSRQEE